MPSMTAERALLEAAAKLSDEQLTCALECAERCALQHVRTQRELVLLRARCLRLELQRRKLTESVVVARAYAAGRTQISAASSALTAAVLPPSTDS